MKYIVSIDNSIGSFVRGSVQGFLQWAKIMYREGHRNACKWSHEHVYIYMPRESEQLVQHDKKMMDVFIITLEAFVGKHTVIF
jgi:hypothetical protein